MSTSQTPVRVTGEFDSGLIIEAARPPHLGGGTQTLLLTPDAARQLLDLLLAKRGQVLVE